MKSLVCSLCSQTIVSEDNENNLALLLSKLIKHVTNEHKEEFKGYKTNLDLLLVLMPAYFAIESFVDCEAMNEFGKLLSLEYEVAEEEHSKADNSNGTG